MRAQHAAEHAAAAAADCLLFFQKQTELSAGSVLEASSLRGSIELMRSPSDGTTEFESPTAFESTMYCRVVRERSLAALGQESVPFIKDPFIKDRDQETDRGRAGTNPQKYSLPRLDYSTSTRAPTCLYYC